MPIWAAGIGAGTDLLSGYLQDKAQKKAFRRQTKMNNAGARRAVGQLQLGTGLEEALLKTATQKRLGGFQNAQAALDLGAVNAQQTVRAQGAQNQADTEQSAVSRGLIGTSTGVQALQGVQGQTTAHLSAIDQALAQQMASLNLEKSNVAAEGDMALANLQSQKTQALYELTQGADPFAVASKKKKKKHGLFKGVYDIGDVFGN